MADDQSKSPATRNQEQRSVSRPREWHPFESLRREVDRLFEEFGMGSSRLPMRTMFDVGFGSQPGWRTAVDITEKDNAYEITAELPGLNERNVDITLSDDMLTIKGEKSESKDEKQKGYHVSERQYGSFQRSFRVPDNVDSSKIEAAFKNGVLTVTLPKSAEAQKKEKKIAIKGG